MSTSIDQHDQWSQAARDRGKPRKLGFDPRTGHLAVYAIVVASGAALLSRTLPWWALALIALVVAVPFVVTFRGRLASQWIAVTAAYTRHRRSRIAETTNAQEHSRWIDFTTPAGTCAVRWEGDRLVAMVQLESDLAQPRVVTDSASPLTNDLVQLETICAALHQNDVALEADIVSTGRRYRRGPQHVTLHAQQAGTDRDLQSERLTWVVLRLDPQQNLAAIARRGPAKVHAWFVMATAAQRLAQQLQIAGAQAYPLTATQADAASAMLTQDADLTAVDERWTRIDTTEHHVTTYWASPEQISTEHLAQWWAWPTLRTTIVLRLATSAGGRIRASAFVRYVSDDDTKPPVPYLTALNGEQAAGLFATLPHGGTSLLDVPSVDIAEVDDIDIPLGAGGQIIGADRAGALVALQLFDQSPIRPTRLTIDLRADRPLVQQITLRALAVGAAVEISTAERREWEEFARLVGEPDRLWFASPEQARTPDIVLLDHAQQLSPSSAGTVINVRAPGTPPPPTDPDILIEQVASDQLLLTTDIVTELALKVTRPRDELRYITAAASAIPPRYVAPAAAAPPAPSTPAQDDSVQQPPAASDDPRAAALARIIEARRRRRLANASPEHTSVPGDNAPLGANEETPSAPAATAPIGPDLTPSATGADVERAPETPRTFADDEQAPALSRTMPAAPPTEQQPTADDVWSSPAPAEEIEFHVTRSARPQNDDAPTSAAARPMNATPLGRGPHDPAPAEPAAHRAADPAADPVPRSAPPQFDGPVLEPDEIIDPPVLPGQNLTRTGGGSRGAIDVDAVEDQRTSPTEDGAALTRSARGAGSDAAANGGRRMATELDQPLGRSVPNEQAPTEKPARPPRRIAETPRHAVDGQGSPEDEDPNPPRRSRHAR